jgi:hypothetical protein
MTAIDIQPVAESAFALMDQDEEEKSSVEEMAVKFRGATNWFARKKMFLDLLDELDATADFAAQLAESPEFAELMENAAAELRDAELPASAEDAVSDEPDAAPGEDASEDDLLPEDPFAVVAPVYIGAILERLDERSIDCLEQAAFYFLSTHPEHQDAANAWLAADPKRLRLFRTFIKANPGYDDAARRILEAEIADEIGEE